MDRLTMGVEEEFLVVDLASGRLESRSQALLPSAHARLGDEVSPELSECEIEVATPVCTDLGDLENHLIRLRAALAAAGEPHGLGVVALGSHPFSHWEGQRVDTGIRRFEEMEEQYRIVAREQVICGCHVHVGIDDPDEVVQVMTRIRPVLPTLLALTGNSPYWNGLDSGYHSYRTQVWQRWPTARMPPTLADRADYDRLVDQLKASGTIDDPSYLYWYARPSVSYPTLEVRIADVCQTSEETTALAALVRALVWRFLDDARSGSSFPDAAREVLEGAVWRAARYGLSDRLVDPTDMEPAPAADVVRATVELAREGLEAAGDYDRVTDVVERLIGVGTGADRQRAAFSEGSRPRDVVRSALAATRGSPLGAGTGPGGN